MIKTVACRVE